MEEKTKYLTEWNELFRNYNQKSSQTHERIREFVRFDSEKSVELVNSALDHPGDSVSNLTQFCSFLNHTFVTGPNEEDVPFIVAGLNGIQSLVQRLGNSEEDRSNRYIYDALFTCMLFYSKFDREMRNSDTWSKAEANTASVLKTICRTLNFSSLHHLWKGAFNRLLVRFSVNCSEKDEWLHTERIDRDALLWLVQQLFFPDLGENSNSVGKILALACPLIDDAKDANQRLGLQILLHVLRNVTETKILWYRDVLLTVLDATLYTREKETLALLLECLELLLKAVSPRGDTTLYDKYLPRLISDMNLSIDVSLQILYIKTLQKLMKPISPPESVGILRHLQPFLKAIDTNIHRINAELFYESLKTLDSLICVTWPVIPRYGENIMAIVLRVVAFLSMQCEDDAGYTSPVAIPEAKVKEILHVGETILLRLQKLCVQEGSDIIPDLRIMADKCDTLRPFIDQAIVVLSEIPNDKLLNVVKEVHSLNIEDTNHP